MAVWFFLWFQDDVDSDQDGITDGIDDDDDNDGVPDCEDDDDDGDGIPDNEEDIFEDGGNFINEGYKKQLI